MERGGGREQRRHVPLNNFKQREFAIFFFLIKVDGERFCWKKFPIFDFFLLVILLILSHMGCCNDRKL